MVWIFTSINDISEKIFFQIFNKEGCDGVESKKSLRSKSCGIHLIFKRSSPIIYGELERFSDTSLSQNAIITCFHRKQFMRFIGSTLHKTNLIGDKGIEREKEYCQYIEPYGRWRLAVCLTLSRNRFDTSFR